MCLNEFLMIDSSDSLECVDILGVMTQQKTLFLKKFYKVVRWCRLEGTRIELLGEFEEWLRIFTEILELK